MTVGEVFEVNGVEYEVIAVTNDGTVVRQLPKLKVLPNYMQAYGALRAEYMV